MEYLSIILRYVISHTRSYTVVGHKMDCIYSNAHTHTHTNKPICTCAWESGGTCGFINAECVKKKR